MKRRRKKLGDRVETCPICKTVVPYCPRCGEIEDVACSHFRGEGQIYPDMFVGFDASDAATVDPRREYEAHGRVTCPACGFYIPYCPECEAVRGITCSHYRGWKRHYMVFAIPGG